MRWQAAAALAAAAFAAGDFAAAAIAASGANPILDPEAAMAALRAGRAFSTEALPLCAGTACACAALLAWAWIGYIFLDDFGRTKPAFLNSTGVMYPSVECILKLLYQCT